MSFCWSVLKWAVLVGLAGAVVAVAILYNQVDAEVRRRAEEHLARLYPDLKVAVARAELVEGEGIKVGGLSIVDPSLAGPRAEMLRVEEAFVYCRADLSGLAWGDLGVRRVLVRRPTLRPTRLADGRWNVAKLLRLPPSQTPPPSVWIENGTIEVLDPQSHPPATLRVDRVSFTLTPCAEPSEPGFGPQTRRFRGTLAGEFLRSAQVEGLIDPAQAKWTLRGSVDGLRVSPELRAVLPGDAASKLALWDALRGLVTAEFRLASGAESSGPRPPVPLEDSGKNPSPQPTSKGRGGVSAEPPSDGDFQAAPIRLAVEGKLSEGRVEDPRLPRPLTDLAAEFRVDNEGLTVRELRAQSGVSTLGVKLLRLGRLGLAGPMHLEAAVRDLELDERLRDILPPALRPEWDKFLPAGKIHADVKLLYDGHSWHPELSVECLDAAFTYYRFPYRLEHVQGWIVWKGDRVDVDLVGDGGSRKVRLWGEVLDPAPGCKFSFNVVGNDMPLEEKLLAALPEQSQAVVAALNPRGAIDATFRCWRDQPGQAPHKTLRVGVRQGGIRYDGFPYPLSNIRGTIERSDDHWDFREFEGTNDTGRITCNGRLDVTGQGSDWELRFSGTNVPLEEELRDALSQPNMQKLWNDLRAEGMVDFEATVRRSPGQQKAELAYLKADLHRDTTRIVPMWFPYRMENLEGTLVYRDGHVRIDQLKAVHGRTAMRAAVDCDFLGDGSWRLRLGGLAVDRLTPDRDLIAALPGQLREATEQLKPGAPVELRGTLELASGGRPDDPLTSAWDLEFTFTQGSLDFGVKLENLNGGLTLRGTYDGRSFHSRGELAVDSLSYQGVQFTRVMGPLEIQDDVLLLGSSVQPSRGEPVRTITAQLFGGTFCGNGRVAIREQPEYELHGTLADGQLSLCAQELIAGRQRLKGDMAGWVHVWGSGRTLNGLGGRGRIELRNADIYQLPLMVALLKSLSLRQPDRSSQSAFSSSDIDFRIHGGHIYLTNITFNGDAFSLEGSGLVDFDTSIQLTFRALLGRREWQLPVVREFFGRVSEEIMVIHVGGTLQDPVRFREPFPGVNEALRQLQGEMQRATGVGPLFPQAGQRLQNGARRLPRK